jgi:hypothetical protein
MTHIDELLASGDDASMQAAALHATNCGDCAELLADWNDLSTTARDLRTTWNSDTLWPRIERKLRSERGAPRTRWMQIAAAVAIMIALGVMSAFALREHNEQRDFEKRIYADNVMNDVEKAEQAHVAAIERLEKLADPKLEQPGSPLMVSYKEKLVLLDDAIAECQTNIERNRRNAHLRRQLLAIYDAKQQTLHDVLREETHVSNP